MCVAIAAAGAARAELSAEDLAQAGKTQPLGLLRWTVPLGAGIGKIFHLGKLPVNTQFGACYNVVHPDNGATGKTGAINVLGAICSFLIAADAWTGINLCAYLLAPHAFAIVPGIQEMLGTGTAGSRCFVTTASRR